MCLKHVEKKKLLEGHNDVAKWLFNYLQKQPPKVFYK